MCFWGLGAPEGLGLDGGDGDADSGSGDRQSGITGDQHDVAIGDGRSGREVNGVVASQTVLLGEPARHVRKLVSYLDVVDFGDDGVDSFHTWLNR